MASLLSRISLLLITTAACASLAQAAPINYSFSISGFSAWNSPAVAPQSTVSGTLTLDGMVLEAFDMTLAGQTYGLADVGVTADSQPDFVTIGGLLHGADVVWWGTNDFFLTVDLQNGLSYIPSMGYSVDNTLEFFTASFGSLKAEPNQTPEPGSLALLGAAALAGLALRRRK